MKIVRNNVYNAHTCPLKVYYMQYSAEPTCLANVNTHKEYNEVQKGEAGIEKRRSRHCDTMTRIH